MTESQLARDLREVTEKINPLIERAEAVFLKAGLTAEAQVDLPRHKVLSFTSKGGRWRLCLVGAGGTELLVNSSRGTRLEALRALPKLEKAILLSKEMDLQEGPILHNAEAFLAELEAHIRSRAVKK